MDRRLTAAIALATMLLLAGCAAGFQPATDAPEPSDPPAENGTELGYYNGYWHNDTFDLDPERGLTEEQKEAVFSRAMARVQLLRGLEFEHEADIELITREEFREEYGADAWPEPEAGVRAIDNAQHEALFLVGPDEDIVDVRDANRGGLVLGFYEPGPERIVIVSGNDPATLDDEITLAHELLHALQDQHFGLASLADDGTLDGVNARNGLVEGDAVVIEREYERNCETGEWQCVEIGGGHSPGAPPSDFHWGVYFAGFFPYAEGPTFVEHHREAGGWDAIDAMYDDTPNASAEIIYPGTYGTDTYGEATVQDRHSAEWDRIATERGGDHARVGQSGLVAMFAHTAFEDRNRAGVIERNEFRNTDSGGLDRLRPFRYDVSYAEGWYADRLHAYESDGDTAHVWNVTFNDGENATEFHTGYREVFEHWDGTRADAEGHTEVWTFDDSDRFEGAVWLRLDGNSLVVVKAPSEAELGEVYAPAAG